MSSMERIRERALKIIPEKELAARLGQGRPLRVKLGIDPTASEIHLGFAVVLRMLRLFQDLGHVAVIIIGDYTAQVGDPTGKSATRPRLSLFEVQENARTYLAQMSKILDMRPEKLEVRHNSEWFGGMRFLDVIELASKSTVQRLLERNDFTTRISHEQPLYLHELLYPLMQGWDSVAVRADVELGGSDQEFNLLMGRELQSGEALEPQVCVMTPLIEGLDGERKMSKSYKNHIGIDEPPFEMMKKVMQIPDKLLERWFYMLTEVSEPEIKMLLAPGTNPRDAKLSLGKAIITLYHSAEAASAAEVRWREEIGKGGPPADMRTVELDGEKQPILSLLVSATGFCESRSEAKRMVAQGAVSLDGLVIRHADMEVTVKPGAVLRCGKRLYARLQPGT